MKKHFLILIAVLLIGCEDKPVIPLSAYAPAKTLLSFPAKDAVCTTGTNVSATESTITFTWEAAKNAQSYELNIKNLSTNSITNKTTTDTQAAVTLSRNTPYSWFIICKSTKTTTTTSSDVWKFYNSGPATVSYPPFPAELTSPALGQNVNAVNNVINLTWTGSDADNDIVKYDVYFGTTNTPVLLQANVADNFLNNVAVTGNTTYYWKVVTRDAAGNSSESSISQFKVN